MSVPFLVDLTSTKAATSKENYDTVYRDQTYIIAQGSLAFLVGFILSRALMNIIEALSKDPKQHIFFFTGLCLFTVVIIFLIASHVFTSNNVRTNSMKYRLS